MGKITLAVALLLMGGTVIAADHPKAGLWEVHITKQVVDGKDRTVQMNDAMKQMQAMLASMPPAQRKQMEQTMGAQGLSGSGGVHRICISPEMASQDKPVVSTKNDCEPTNYHRSGNTITFELKCPTMTGTGQTTVNGNTMTSKMDVVTNDSHGRHTMHSESKMKYLGADCKGIKPLDQVAREMEQQQGK